MKLPTCIDNSEWAKAVRATAVKFIVCPRCGAVEGAACCAANGRAYNPRHHVHAARMRLAGGAIE